MADPTDMPASAPRVERRIKTLVVVLAPDGSVRGVQSATDLIPSPGFEIDDSIVFGGQKFRDGQEHKPLLDAADGFAAFCVAFFDAHVPRLTTARREELLAQKERVRLAELAAKEKAAEAEAAKKKVVALEEAGEDGSDAPS